MQLNRKQAVEFIIKKVQKSRSAKYDLIIVGAGPAGISATLTAAQNNLKFLTIEQESLAERYIISLAQK